MANFLTPLNRKCCQSKITYIHTAIGYMPLRTSDRVFSSGKNPNTNWEICESLCVCVRVGFWIEYEFSKHYACIFYKLERFSFHQITMWKCSVFIVWICYIKPFFIQTKASAKPRWSTVWQLESFQLMWALGEWQRWCPRTVDENRVEIRWDYQGFFFAWI